MKICIPAEDDKGLDGKVSGHFGSAPFFCVYDNETKQTEFIKNGEEGHEHGGCAPVGKLIPLGITAILCTGIGAGAASKLNAAGIKVYKSSAVTIKEMINLFNEGKVQELDMNDCCAGHSH